MQQAIDLNNQGSLLVRNGCYEDAVLVLNEALAMVQNDLTNPDNEELDVHEPQQADHTLVIDQQEHQELPVSTSSEENCRKDSCSQRSSSITNDETNKREQQSSQTSMTMMMQAEDEQKNDFIYRTPIHISSKYSVDYSTLSVTVVFNLALAHQLTAIADNNDKRRLYAALKLYEVGYMMQRNATEQGFSSARLNLSHTMGLVNNCGQIYKQLGQKKRASRFFRNLLSTLILVGEADDHQDEEERIDQLEGFWQTASQLILKDPELASAA